MRVAITGATGLIGRALARRLLGRDDQVIALTRDPEAARERLPEGTRAERWTVGEPDELAEVLDGLDAVVNLAGAPVVGRRWNESVMTELRRSRVEGTRTVVAALRAAAEPPRVLVNASASGFYGHREEPEVTEEEGPGNDFLAELCAAWEAEARRAEEQGVRVVLVRIGIVLAGEGGALPKMIPPLKAFLGGAIGNGRQGFPWIHLDDMTGLLLHALDHDEVRGPMNGAAPAPLSNSEFTKALGRALRRPSWLPVPRFILRIVIGRAAAALTTGQRMVPARALETGYAFRFPDLDSALQDLL